ncbi:CsgE family curli-type amyloid fiber assembly protein [Burkholderia sp. S171]|uniref:CsgE family curli-type amyloid fiber assembly protein n=1 Tax=Burkholderia sp. S171 TaxID=1641860 RepID=UPI00131E05D9|nr:CsgE family curli-type amyloid fiber assembly protein [Burkholderia sp. S171]
MTTVHAQDTDQSGQSSASNSQARPLISIPNSPAPSSLAKVSPAAVTPSLTNSATITNSTKSNNLPGRHDVNNQTPLAEEIGGIVTDDAVTLVGQDFYAAFAQAWIQMPMSERYMVSIHERPSARYGSLIWVEFEQRRIFEAFLPIARANVRPVAQGAAASSLQTVIQADIARLLFHETDLGSDEL